MHTYEGTKLKAIETISRAAMAMITIDNHEANRKLANSIIDAARTLLWLEDLTEAYENGDLSGMFEAKANNGF